MATTRDSEKRSLRLVLILGGLSAFGPLSIDMYLPAFPSISADLHAGPSAVQLTLTACLVGLSGGQLVAGPLSDTLGRRRPLLVGLAGYTVLSAVCGLAPSVAALTVFRLLQALCGAAGLVIANASVRDRYAGTAMSRFLSTLLLVNGAAPVLAPVIGGQILRLGPWRLVFALLTVIGVILLVSSALWLEESLPPDRRRPGSLATTLRTYRGLLRDRVFVGYALAGGLTLAAMFAYIAGSSFVFQDIYRLSPQGFSAVFAVNSLGIVAVGQVNGRLVGRFSPRSLLACGLATASLGGVALLVAVLTGLGLPAILPALFVLVASIGLINPNAVSLALAGYPERAGTAAALIGVLQYLVGGLVAPLVGIGGSGTALPMALVMAVLPLLSMTVFRFGTRRDRRVSPRSA